nr:putative porin [Bacteroidota bacterium]
LDDNYFKYQDDLPLSGFYSDIYADSLKTFDSTYFFKIENEIAWERLDNKRHRGAKDLLGLSFSVKDQLVRIQQREIDTVFNNVSAAGKLYNTYSLNRFFWEVSAKYTLAGYNAGDQLYGARIKKGFGDSLNMITLAVSSNEKEADFIYNHFSSNHFKWENNFIKTKEQKVELDVVSGKWNAAMGGAISLYSNIPYFDNYARSRQYIGTIPVYSAYIKKNVSLMNWHLDNKINYQYVPDSTVIRLPALVLQHSLYYENDVFKGAMNLQIGFSVFYNSEYFADRYMPATGQFYLQDDKKYGNYPVIDFFINTQIKQARIFFKIDHLNSGLMGNGYVLTPSYPLNDRAFKLGISWKFFD